MKEVTPKTEAGNYKYRLHQYLTTDIGKENAKQIIHEVTALAAVSKNKDEFNDLFVRMYQDEPMILDSKNDENNKINLE